MRRRLALVAVFSVLGLLAAVLAVYIRPPTGPLPVAVTPAATPGGLAKPAWAGIYEQLDWFVWNVPAERQYKEGSHYRFDWNSVETDDQNFNWEGMDNWTDEAHAVGFKIISGLGTLSWTGGSEPNDGIILPDFMLDEVDEGVYFFRCPAGSSTHRIPLYWSEDYLTEIQEIATAVANHLKNDPQGQYVQAFEAPLGNHIESAISGSPDQQCILTQMYTDYLAGHLTHLNLGSTCTDGSCTVDDGASIWAATESRMLEIWHDAFQAESLNVGLIFMPQPIAFRNWERQIVANYGASLGMAPKAGRVLYDGSNWLSYGAYGGGWGSYDVYVDRQETNYAGGEMSDYISDPIPPTNPPTDLALEERSYWSILSAIDKHIDAIFINFDAGNPWNKTPWTNLNVARSLRYFKELAGRTAADTPYVMSVLRETQFTDTYGRGQCGDFDFYLYHQINDHVDASGNAIPYCPPTGVSIQGNQDRPVYDAIGTLRCDGDNVSDPDCDPRGRYARRTQPGNRYMYFDVDDYYAYGPKNGWIAVTFDDTGTDRIGITYNDGGGLIDDLIAKTNTGTWRTYTWTVGINLANVVGGNQADFAVYDGADGADTVHMVRAAFSGAGAAVPTSTPTPTRTPTPLGGATSTPTPTPTRTPTATPTDSAHLLEVLCDSSPTCGDTSIRADTPNTNYGGVSPNRLIAQSTGVPTGVPTEYPYAVGSTLFKVPGTFPTDTVFQQAHLGVYVSGFSGGPILVTPCQVTTAWDEWTATWNVRAAGTPWPTPGAYGVSVLGPCGTPVAFSSSDLYQWRQFDVKSVMSLSGLNIKLQPVCTPDASGRCAGQVSFASKNSGSTANRPFFVASFTTGSTLTATPTVTPSATRLPTSTFVWTSTPTSTITPTPTRTPTTPAGATATNTPTVTPSGTALPTLTSTPTPAAASLKLNEVCARMTNVDLWPDGVLNAGDNAVEIVNRTGHTLSLASYMLCSGSVCKPLSGGIDNGGYKVLYQALGEVDLVGANDTVGLYHVLQSEPVDLVSIAYQNPNRCYARLWDASGPWVESSWPTMGFGNSSWSVTPTPTVTPTRTP